MERKKKLAKLILIEIQSLEQARHGHSLDQLNRILVLAEEITKDAKELALLVEHEENLKSA